MNFPPRTQRNVDRSIAHARSDILQITSALRRRRPVEPVSIPDHRTDVFESTLVNLADGLEMLPSLPLAVVTRVLEFCEIKLCMDVCTSSHELYTMSRRQKFWRSRLFRDFPAAARSALANRSSEDHYKLYVSHHRQIRPSTVFGDGRQLMAVDQADRQQLNALVAAILAVGLKKGLLKRPSTEKVCLHVDIKMRFRPREDGGLDAVFSCKKCTCSIATPASNLGSPLRKTQFWTRLTDESFLMSLLQYFYSDRTSQ